MGAGNGSNPVSEKDLLTSKVLECAIEVHRVLGPGLLESVYEECLCWELNQAGLATLRQVPLPVKYKQVTMDIGYRIDVIVERQVILELKTVDKIAPVHEAQLLTSLRLSRLRTGLLLNFNAPVLRAGIKRMVL